MTVSPDLRDLAVNLGWDLKDERENVDPKEFMDNLVS